MPIYGYRCQQCGHELEVLQSMSDPPLRACPECMGPLRKMMYPVGVQFKGSGFYTTDYKSRGSGANGSSESKDAGEGKPAKSEGKSEGRSEGKSEGKSEGRSEGRSESKSESKRDSKE